MVDAVGVEKQHRTEDDARGHENGRLTCVGWPAGFVEQRLSNGGVLHAQTRRTETHTIELTCMYV